MSEKHIKGHEHAGKHELTVDHEHHERVHRHHESEAERARQQKSHENVAKIEAMAKAHAEEAKTVEHEQPVVADADSLPGMQQSLKTSSYQRTLAKTRQKLPKPARAFSKLVHNEVVDKISSVSAATVSRPSGVLGGSICAFLGSLVVLYYSKHYGFRYNYLMLFILFAGGFAVGATLELIVWLVHGRKQHY